MHLLLASSLRSIRGTPSLTRASALLTCPTPLARPVQQIRYEGGAAHTSWKMGKLTAGITYVALPVGIMYPHPILSYTLGICIPLYTYFCFHEIVTDYTNKKPLLNFILNTSTILITTAGLVALGYFNFTDVGIANALRGLLSL